MSTSTRDAGPIDAGLRHGVMSGPELAAQAIANKATREGFDLVVMGSHGHGALAHIVLGSVATQVLALCKVPVLLIR